jgi:NAD(P)-dependent dehydrogenase (short-subunit alcohol dehydrogenase family)
MDEPADGARLLSGPTSEAGRFTSPTSEAGRFASRVAIVTGAARGIGYATALRLAREGASVVLADLKDAEAAAQRLRDAGCTRVLALRCDVGDESQVVTTVETAIATFGALDIVVNNAGKMIFKPIEQHSEADLLGVLRVDLFGAFFFTKQALLKMRAAGAIVNVSSIHAVETTPLVSAYAAAKAALLSLTRSAAIEGRAKGIRVNAVLPGAIETPMLHDNPNLRSGAEVLDPQSIGRPEDVAAAIAWLASDDSRFVEGALLRVDGGRLARL